MSVNPLRLRQVLKSARLLLVLLVTVALLLTVTYEIVQCSWHSPKELSAREAFFEGSIGTEVMPLPAAIALPKLYPQHFQPAGQDAGDWIEQFGLLRGGPEGLPLGFTLSNRRPKSGAPSPVPFVALSCVLCHSTEIRPVDGTGPHQVIGPGSHSINLFAWLDAFQAALMEEDLTAQQIIETYEAETRNSLGMAERVMTRLWLSSFREAIRGGFPRFDEPFGHGRSRDPEITASGPSRTFPFRTIVRNVLERPGANMAVYTKISSVFQQDRRTWAQVDGSVKDLHLRSALAAFAAGATPQNLRIPEIEANVRLASDFTRDLSGPLFSELFPAEAAALDADSVTRGAAVYREHCSDCHGGPGPDGLGWRNGERTGQIVHYSEVGTDAERVTFRHVEDVSERLAEMFTGDHPFAIAPGDLRDMRPDESRGFINAPIERVYLRAPYLHNASVLTLAELIHLKPRKPVFYRGRNQYDPEDVGLVSPEASDHRVYFRFDTAIRGNSNRGHDYPWAWDDPSRDPAALRDLLSYLKTL